MPKIEVKENFFYKALGKNVSDFENNRLKDEKILKSKSGDFSFILFIIARAGYICPPVPPAEIITLMKSLSYIILS